MADDSPFLDAIAADPDEDAPRLAHADWLEANGDPARAEFVRLQVAAAHWPYDAMHEQRRRIAALLAANRTRWLAGRPEKQGMEWRFVRGYPEQLRYGSRTAFSSTWRRALAFPVRMVLFHDLRDMRRLADEPGLASIRCLGLSKMWESSDDGLRAVLESPHLQTLETLSVSEGRLTVASLALIASCPKLAGLRELSLWSGISTGGVPTRDDIAALLASPNVARLRVLRLAHWEIGGEAGRTLWQSRLPQLRELYLFGNKLAGLPGLGDGSQMPALECLTLSSNELGDDDAETLARATRWAALRKLELWSNLVADRGVRALAAAPHLAGLRRLVLARNPLGDGGAQALAVSSHHGTLETLDLSRTFVGDAGMAALGRSSSLRSLRWLFVEGTPARPGLGEAVAARFREGRPPLPEEERVPAAPRAEAQPSGDADEDGLVRAILADPWDELARSAYADWLEEQGAPLHAQLLRHPNERQRILALLHPAIVEAFNVAGTGMPNVIRDGLLTVPMTLGGFLKKAFQARAGEVLRGQRIARLDLDGTTKDWTRVGDAPALAHLRGLVVDRTAIRDDGAAALARCRGLGALCSLDLRRARLGERGVAALCGSEHLGRLVHLALPAAGTSVGGLRSLASGPLGDRLRHLDATDCRFSDAGLAVLLGMRALTTLILPGCHLGDRAARALADAELPALRTLDWSHNGLGEAGVDALVSSGLLSRLRRLRAGFSEALVRAVEGTPGLVLAVPRGLPAEAEERLRATLGDRLVLE